MKRLYLSPSNQPANRYAFGGTNEKIEMEAIAKAVAFYFRDFEIEVFMATLGLDFWQRDEEAKALGCTDYMAIHSNAGGGGKGIGTVALYHPDQPDSIALAKALVLELDAICPYPENRSEQVQNGMKAFDGYGLGEVREPKKKGMISLLLEVNFHDNPIVAKWIIESKDLIAQKIVKAYSEALGVSKKVVAEPVKVPPVIVKPEEKDKLVIDGYLGKKTITALQGYFGTPKDGKISKPSMVVKRLQKLLKVNQDGYMGEKTIKALQKRMGTPIDGVISEPSMMVKELQRRLNKNKL